MDYMIIAFALVVILMLYLKACEKAPKDLPPRPRSALYPLIGHLPIIMTMNYKTLAEMGQQLGGVFSLHFFRKDYIVLSDWKAMKEALQTHSEAFSGRAHTSFTKRKMTTSLLLWDGPTWKEKRRYTLQHFRDLGFGKSSMEQVILDEACKMMKVMDNCDGKKVVFNDFFFMMIVNVIWGVIAGKTYSYDDAKMKNFCQIMKNIFKYGKRCMPVLFYPILEHLPGDPFKVHAVEVLNNQIWDFLRKSIDEHIEVADKNEPHDYIGFYVTEILKRKEAHGKVSDDPNDTDSNCFTKEHLVGNLYDILHGGVESTVATLEWALVYMAVWPEIQKKVQDELDSVIGNDRLPSFADRSNLPYTKATIQEIQRFSTVIPMGAPRRVLHPIDFMGYKIKADTFAILHYWALHNDKSLWGDPEVFRPERFLNDSGKTEKFDYFIPFSQGSRSCIGESLAQMELFLFVACFLQRYSFHYVTGEAPPSLIPAVSLSLQPQRFSLVIRRRL